MTSARFRWSAAPIIPPKVRLLAMVAAKLRRRQSSTGADLAPKVGINAHAFSDGGHAGLPAFLWWLGRFASLDLPSRLPETGISNISRCATSDALSTLFALRKSNNAPMR